MTIIFVSQGRGVCIVRLSGLCYGCGVVVYAVVYDMWRSLSFGLVDVLLSVCRGDAVQTTCCIED